MPRLTKSAKKTEEPTPIIESIVEIVEEPTVEEVAEEDEVVEDLDEEEKEAIRVLAEIKAKKQAKQKIQAEEKIKTLEERISNDELTKEYNRKKDEITLTIADLTRERDELTSGYYKSFQKELGEISELKGTLTSKAIAKNVTVEGKRTRTVGVSTREHEALHGIKELKFRQHVITCETDAVKIIYRHKDLSSNSINGIVSKILLEEGVKSQVNCWEKINVIYYDTESNIWKGIGGLRDAWRVKNSNA